MLLRWTYFLLGCVLCLGCGPSADPNVNVRNQLPEGSMEPIDISATDWPWWRGKDRDGLYPKEKPPLQWGPNKNVIWKASVPGSGHSSATVVGDRVFVTYAEEQTSSQHLIAFSRDSGEMLWDKQIHKGRLPKIHSKNTHASATCACDGERVFTSFYIDDAIHVSAVSLEGEILWQTRAGGFNAQHGYGASPVLYEAFVIVSGDSTHPESFIAALHRETGEIIWRTGRPLQGTYSTPIIGKVAGRDQLLLSGAQKICSYDPRTGDLIWECAHPARVTSCTMAFGDELVYASGGYPAKAIRCVRATGSGDVTGSHLVWEENQKSLVTYVPSPLFYQGHLYVITDKGIGVCFDGQTGEVKTRKRLDGDYTSSPVLVGNHILATNERGQTTIFTATPELEEVGTCELPENTYATPTIVSDRMYLRTQGSLYCLGKTE